MVEFKDITKDEVEYYKGLMEAYEVDSMDLNSAEVKHGELLNTILNGDSKSIEKARKELKAVEKRLNVLRREREAKAEERRKETQKEKEQKEEDKQLERQRKHEEIMHRQSQIANMNVEELLKEKDRLGRVNLRNKPEKKSSRRRGNIN